MKKKKGTFFMTIGLLLLAAALGFTGYNIYESKQAQIMSDNVVNIIREEIALADTEDLTNKEAETNTEDAINTEDIEIEEIPDYVKYPEKEMPTIKINGEGYIGILDIPGIGVSLPVMGGDWSYSKLKVAPCRYSGSIYENSLVVAAHNYSSHFGKIKNLDMGAEIIFTDIEGNIFKYVVEWVDILQSTATEEMKNGEEWDLTLFTCTYSGGERYTVRCVKKE